MPDEIRSSEALDPGSLVPIEGDDGPTEGTVVLDADDADRAVNFFVQNNTDVPVTLHLKSEDFPELAGIVLAPAAFDAGVLTQPGGHWEERNYAGVVSARHHGATGAKNLTRVIW